MPSPLAITTERPAVPRTAERSDVCELALCEAAFLCLRPDQLYRFTVQPGCEACRQAAKAALG